MSTVEDNSTLKASEYVGVIAKQYNGFRSEDAEELKLYLDTLGDPSHINLPLCPYPEQDYLRSPWLNETVLNYNIKKGNLSVIKYLLTEWEHRDVIIKDRCICHPGYRQGITLPPLLLTILCQKQRNIEKTVRILELLTTHFKSDEIGMNWVCGINTQREQRRYYYYNYYYKFEEGCEGLLFVNENYGMCWRKGKHDIRFREGGKFYVGSMMAALVWRCREIWYEMKMNGKTGRRAFNPYLESRWADWYRYDNKTSMQKMITILVKNGLDLNISGDCHKFKEGHERGRLIDLKELWQDEREREFTDFFEESVRRAWETHVMPIIEESCAHYEGLSEIFKYVLTEYLRGCKISMMEICQ